MEILVAGNSQAGCLVAAQRGNNNPLAAHAVAFDTTPGGTGPYLTVNPEQRLVLSLPDLTRQCSPEGTAERRVTEFDVIVISALGYVDGGFAFDNPIVRQGKLHAFEPLPENKLHPVSIECYEQTVEDMVHAHYGMRLIGELRAVFGGRIIVQPMPLLSALVPKREDWRLAALYKQPMKMSRFLLDLQARCLQNVCADHDAELLDFPNPLWRDAGFTPPHLMSEIDGFHPTPEYGVLVLQQVADRLAA